MHRATLVSAASILFTVACGSPEPTSLENTNATADNSSTGAPSAASGEDTSGTAATAAPASSPKPEDGPCFTAASNAKRVSEIFDSGATIDKLFLVGSRLAVVHGDELSTLPSSGGGARFIVGNGAFLDAVPSSDRVFMLEGGGFLSSSTAMLETRAVISAHATSGIGLHVDDDYIYLSARLGYSEGSVARHERTNVYSMPGSNLPVTLAEGPSTKWIGGTRDRLFVIAHDDDGARSDGAVYSMAKPNGDGIVPVITFEKARPVGFVIDDSGGVVAVSGEYGSPSDEIAAFAHDGSSVSSLVEEPKGSISSVVADVARVYYVSSRTTLKRVARSGGAAEIVASSSTCQITAIASESAGLYVATTKPKSNVREIWFFTK